MNLYTSLTLRYLKENKKRTIVTIIGIILSTALICGIGNIYSSFMDYQMRETIKDRGSFYASFYDINKENIDYISKAAGVDKYAISKESGYANIGESSLLKIKKYDKVAMEGFPVSLKEGKLPTNKNEIVISENNKNVRDKVYKIGDEIKLSVGERASDGKEELNDWAVVKDEYIKNPEEKIFKVVGIINSPNYEYNNDITMGISYIDLAEVSDNENINISITVKNPKDIYTLAPELAENAKMEQKTDNNGAKYYNIEYNEGLLRLLGASGYNNIRESLGAIIMLVTSLVIVCTIATVYNAFSISISERKKQFGILNSIGATNSQIMKLVFTEGILVSIIAIPIGLLSGTVAMDIVFKVIQNLFSESFIAEMDLRVVYDPSIMILSTVVVLITIFISVILPAYTAAKISPLDAIKNSGGYKIGKVKNSKLVKLLLKTEGELAYKNLRRNKNKFRITLFSLIISVVIFVAFSGFMTLFLKAETVRNGQMTHDMYMSARSEITKEQSDNIRKELNDIKGINNYSEQTHGFNFNLDLNEKNINKNNKETILNNLGSEQVNGEYQSYNNGLFLPGDKSIKNLNLTSGSFDKDAAIKEMGVILVNKAYYESPGKKGAIDMTNYKVGDNIEVYTTIYDEDGNESKDHIYKLKIMGTTEDILTGKNSYNYMGIQLITYDEVGEKLGLDIIKNEFSIDSDKTEETRTLVKKLAEKYDFDFTDEAEEAMAKRHSFMAMQVFVYGFVSVISLVSITNIVNTISTNINLRKRELAIIKSIGVTPGGFNKMIYLESFLYGVLSLLYGVPLGIGLCVLMNKMLGNVIEFGLVLPWAAVGISIIGIFVITFIASYIPMKKINKENIIENIRQESI